MQPLNPDDLTPAEKMIAVVLNKYLTKLPELARVGTVMGIPKPRGREIVVDALLVALSCWAAYTPGSEEGGAAPFTREQFIELCAGHWDAATAVDAEIEAEIIGWRRP